MTAVGRSAGHVARSLQSSTTPRTRSASASASKLSPTLCRAFSMVTGLRSVIQTRAAGAATPSATPETPQPAPSSTTNSPARSKLRRFIVSQRASSSAALHTPRPVRSSSDRSPKACSFSCTMTFSRMSTSPAPKLNACVTSASWSCSPPLDDDDDAAAAAPFPAAAPFAAPDASVSLASSTSFRRVDASSFSSDALGCVSSSSAISAWPPAMATVSTPLP
mmetsp:Transcript_40708/g.127348  ORF Transcript_40708/g.127348 Transcript_40708/m.127348 type:complete len:221 (-) Transcript_40708:342-1004(-)